MARRNPLLKALDVRIAALRERRHELDAQIDALEAARGDLESRVRRRPKVKSPPPTFPASAETAA